MNALQFLHTTMVGGLFLLVPLTVIGMIALQIVRFMRPITAYLAQALGMTHGVRVLEVLALLVLCLLAGLLMRLGRVGHVSNWLERNILSLLPGYEYIRMRMNELLSPGGADNSSAILLRLDDSWCPARLIETGDDGTSVVFIPDTPQGNSGTVLVVESDRVQRLNVPYAKLAESVRHYGRGLQAIKRERKA